MPERTSAPDAGGGTRREEDEYPLNDKEWTDALFAGASALEGVADATTGWKSHDARVFAARLRYRAEKIRGPRDPHVPEADPNG